MLRSTASATLHGGGYSLLSCIVVVVRLETLASLQCRDGLRRVPTDQADIACTKREASTGVRRVGGNTYVYIQGARSAVGLRRPLRSLRKEKYVYFCEADRGP